MTRKEAVSFVDKRGAKKETKTLGEDKEYTYTKLRRLSLFFF